MTEAKQWIKTLRYLGMFWLRYESQCPIVTCERPPDYSNNFHPDILGITRSRKFVEIEIKVSASDLRCDKLKRRHDSSMLHYQNPAHRFYYLVPPKLESIALAEITVDFGILGLRYLNGDAPQNPNDGFQTSVTVLRKAKSKDKPLAKLSQCVRMAENVSATAISMAKEIAKLHLR